MKIDTLLTISLFAILSVPATYGDEANQPAAPEKAQESHVAPAKQHKALIVINDISSDESIASAIPYAKSLFAKKLSERGITTINDDILFATVKKHSGKSALKDIPPADLASMLGADFVCVVTLSAPHEETRIGTINGVPVKNKFISFPLSVALAFSDGETIAEMPKLMRYAIGEVSNDQALTSATTQNFALKALTQLSSEFAQLAIDKQISSKEPATTDEAEISLTCSVPAMRLPILTENENGKFALTESAVPAHLGGINISINGIDYMLNADGSPTKITLPRNRIAEIKISHPDIVPVSRIVNIRAPKQTFDFFLELSDSARERWLKDAESLNALIEQIQKSKRKDALTDADVALLRGKAEFWSKSKMNFNYLKSKKESHTVEETEESEEK